MEIHNEEPPTIYPEKQYAVGIVLNSGHSIQAVLKGQVVDAIRHALAIAPHDRRNSISWKSDDHVFLTTSSIAFISVSETRIFND